MLERYKNIMIYSIVFLLLFNANGTFGKEISGAFGTTYQTNPDDPSLVKFVRIRGKKIQVLEDLNNQEIIQHLKHKQFVQFLERSGKYCKVRIHHPEGNYEGWINKFKVYNTKGMIKFYFGKPLLMKSDEQEMDPKDVEFEVNKTAWTIKDKTQLLELPEEDSTVIFDVYFGKELYLKKQRGNYYLVEIPSSGETISGWIRSEDVGNKEFYFAKYDKSMAEYTRTSNSLTTEISELEAYIVELNEELEDLESEHQMLHYQKAANIKILANSTKKRKNYLLDEKKIAEEIEEGVKRLQKEINSIKVRNRTINKELDACSNDLFKLNAEHITMGKRLSQYKNELPLIMPKLKVAYEQKKIYYLAHKEEIDRKMAEEAKKKKERIARKKASGKKIKTDPGNTEQCKEFEKEYKAKIAEFEKVKAEMSKGDVSKKRYEELYIQYTDLWNEAGQIKKQLKECEFNASSKHKALYNEAIGLKKEDELEDALELFLEAISIKDDFEEAYYQIVFILIELEEDSDIDQYLSKISDPESKGKLLNRRAHSEKNNHPKRAIKYYKQMAKYYKPDLAYYHIGLIYIEKLSSPKSAIKYFKMSLKKNSKDPKVYEALGAAVFETKPPKGKSKKTIIEDAITYFEKGIKYGKGYKNLHVLCARNAQAYNELGKAKSALKYANMAIKNAPNNNIATGFLEKGIALVKMDKKKEAEKYLNKAKKDLITKDQAVFWLKEIN